MKTLIGEGLAFKATQTEAERELGPWSSLLALCSTPLSLLLALNEKGPILKSKGSTKKRRNPLALHARRFSVT